MTSRCPRCAPSCSTTWRRASGSAATSSSSTRIRTLDRDFLSPSVQGGSAYVDGARIILADVDASNGVIHVIDRVLVPGS